MSKKVLQDITSRAASLRKKKFTRKWDYGNGGDGIVDTDIKKAKVSKEEEIHDVDEDIFGIEDENPIKTNLEDEVDDTEFYGDDESTQSGGKKKYI